MGSFLERGFRGTRLAVLSLPCAAVPAGFGLRISSCTRVVEMITGQWLLPRMVRPAGTQGGADVRVGSWKF